MRPGRLMQAADPVRKHAPRQEAIDMRKIRATALVFLILGGCAVGPDYQRPAVETPQAWRFEERAVQDLADTRWWEQFNDPILNALITAALRENKDLRIATARLEEYRGRYAL